MEFLGTKGKWFLKPADSKFESYTVAESGKIIGYSTQNTLEAKANELLRSKAPELLELLIEAGIQLFEIEKELGPEDTNLLSRIEALIKQSTELNF